MNKKIDFYAPYQMPDGRNIYGAAAANRRIADAGNLNELAYQLVMTGINLGYQQAQANNLNRTNA